MSRLVEAKSKPSAERGAADFAGGESSADEKIKEYGERVAKYIPAEVLAFYVGAVQLIATKDSDDNHLLRLWLFGIFALIGLVSTPLWLGKFSTDNATRRPNQVAGFVAFTIWAYAYPAGIFHEAGLYDPFAGALILLVFTFVSGFYQPTKPA